MRKKTIYDETFGEITYTSNCWKVKRKEKIEICGMNNDVQVELQIMNTMYEEFVLGILDEELMQFHEQNPELLDEEEAVTNKKKQRNMYIKYFKDNKRETFRNIEEAALRKREEMLEGQTEESFSKIVGKEKAKRCFEANTREEKLASLELKRMRIFKDCIEITCTCDWFKPSGGFSVFEDGSVEMLYVDSMSI